MLESGCSGPGDVEAIQLTAKHALAERMVVMYEFGVLVLLGRTDLDSRSDVCVSGRLDAIGVCVSTIGPAATDDA